MISTYMVGGSMVWCPKCKARRRVAVLDSRESDPVFGRRRRRGCLTCNYRWTTVEVPIELLFSVRELRHNVKNMQASVQLMHQVLNDLALPPEEIIPTE